MLNNLEKKVRRFAVRVGLVGSLIFPTGCAMTPQGEAFLQGLGTTMVYGAAYGAADEIGRGMVRGQQERFPARGNQNFNTINPDLYDPFNDPYSYPQITNPDIGRGPIFAITNSNNGHHYVIYGARKDPFGTLMKVFDKNEKKFIIGYVGQDSFGRLGIIPPEQVRGSDNSIPNQAEIKVNPKTLEDNVNIITYDYHEDRNNNGEIDDNEFFGVRNNFRKGEKISIATCFRGAYKNNLIRGDHTLNFKIYSPNGELVKDDDLQLYERSKGVGAEIFPKEFNESGIYRLDLSLDSKYLKSHRFEVRE